MHAVLFGFGAVLSLYGVFLLSLHEEVLAGSILVVECTRRY